VTEPRCGTPHHRYPDTLCTEPAGHYQPDRDPHAGPLIIDGRQAGAAAWDEPKEQQHMTDRHTADSITSDALDQLYDQLATAEQACEQLQQRLDHAKEDLRHRTETATAAPGADALRADQAEAAIARAHHVANLIAAGAPWTANLDDTANRLREALDGQP